MSTEQLVSQLVLAAEWDFDDPHTDPVAKAATLLGVPLHDPRVAQVLRRVTAVKGLDWSEQVGLAAHLLLASDEVPAVAA